MSEDALDTGQSTASSFWRQARDAASNIYSQVSQVSARILPSHQSTGMLAAGFVLLVTLITVAANTRAVISPFYDMNPIWVFFAICAYAAGFTFSKSLTMTARFLRPFSLAYFFLSVFFVLMFIWPNSNAFDEPIIRGSSGMFALLFLSVYGGVLCGDIAQSDALGDAYFRAHILPQLQSNNPPISLLGCDFSGEYQLIDSKSLNIQWNSGVKELQLNGYPLLFYSPVFVDNRHLTCAKEKFLEFINNQPRTKREAMKHYINNINLGHKRFQSLYSTFYLGFHHPLTLSKPNQFIEIQRFKIRIGNMDYTIQWSVPDRAWSSMYLDDRLVLNQAIDPMNQFPSERDNILQTERQIIQKIMPDFCEKNLGLGISFHRSFINFLLAFRRGEFQPEARMRIMLAVSQWVLDYRRRAPPRPSKKSTARTVSIDEWQRIEQLLETEGVSLFMRMYNWLNDYAENVEEDSQTALSIEKLIQDGFDVVRSEKPVSTSSQASINLAMDGREISEKKIKLHVTTLNWIFFASSMVALEELPV